MKKRWSNLMAAGLVSLSMLQPSLFPGMELLAQAAEEGSGEIQTYAEDSVILQTEEVSDALIQEETTAALETWSESSDTIQIEGIEVIESYETDEKTEKKISEYLKERSERLEKEQQQTSAQLPEGFYVDPLQYPQAVMSENVLVIYRYLTEELELNHAAACGVLANIHLESSFRPICFGDGGTSYGICQWHLGRFSALVNYCRVQGLDYNTLEGQLAYLKAELECSYRNVLSYIRSVPDTAMGAYDAAYYWCVNFELPDHKILRGQQRGNLARDQYYPQDYETGSWISQVDFIVETDLKKMSDRIFYLEESIEYEPETIQRIDINLHVD
jgi:hypothetical protein